MLQAPFSGISGVSEDYENENFIWGTTIRAHQITRELEQFFLNFTEEGADEAKYITLLREVMLILCHPYILQYAYLLIRLAAHSNSCSDQLFPLLCRCMPAGRGW